MNEARRIRSEKLLEHQHIERYNSCLESKRVERVEDRTVEQIWEYVKRAMLESAREI